MPCDLSTCHKSGRCFVPELAAVFQRALSRWPREAGLSVVFLDSLLASILSDEKAVEGGYLHSRTLARLLFAQYPGVDAIMYPSIARSKAFNLAILPAAADKILQPLGTSVILIRGAYDFGLFDFAVVRDAASWPVNGPIIWR